MNITLVTAGSRGDVQPYIALGKGIQACGHNVQVCTHTEFEDFVCQQGLAFAPMHGNPKALLEDEAGQRFLESGRNPIRFMRSFSEFVNQLLHGVLQDCLAACQDSDFVIFSIIGWFAVTHVMEKLNIPGISAYLQPVSPTSAFPVTSFPPVQLGKIGNRLSYTISEQFGWSLMRAGLNRARKDVLDLPPLPFIAPFERMHKEHFPVLYGFSQHVVPRPADWPDSLHITGYWFLDEEPDWQPPEALSNFLEAGPPPVYIGFGSMRARGPQETTRMVLRALELSEQRGVLLSGWGALEKTEFPETVIQIEAAPHAWLFPRMAAVVHHAGSGTTAAGLRAGVPTIGVPFFADQPFWAERAYRLGAGPRPVDRKRLTAERLAAAISQAVGDPAYRQNAERIGAQLRIEDGVQNAVETLARYFP